MIGVADLLDSDFMTVERPRYRNPPVVEVICGVWYPPLPGLDPLLMGAYWASRRDDYPLREVHPAVDAAKGLRLHRGVAPMRAWLLSKDKNVVIQVQSDRFYLNWRRIPGGSYPSFSSVSEGLRDRTIREFDVFAAYCEQHLGRRPTPLAVEVGKVDHIAWTDKADFTRHAPSLAGLLTLVASEKPQIVVGVADAGDKAEIRIQIATVMVEDKEGEQFVVRLETTGTQTVQAGAVLSDAFNQANQKVNQVFYDLIPEIERDRRYGREQ